MAADRRLRRERWVLLHRLDTILEPVMVLLAGIWLIILVAELVGGGLPPQVDLLMWSIWIAFIAHFGLGLLIAPVRSAYLKRNWLTAISLVVPAFRILRVALAFRLLRAASVVRSLGLLRVVTSLNRGLAALGRTMRRRGLAYVAASTAMVMIIGAAAMMSLESGSAADPSPGDPTDANGTPFEDYADSLYWTANTMTTGPTTKPRTPEGRLLGWLLSVYGLAVFGYLTATLASHFIGRERSGIGPPSTAASPPRR
jgi:voltage-gated potassium channel